MSSPHRNRLRVLGIDPSTRGFGYAVIEDNGRLIARGVAHIPSRRTRDLLDRVERLFSVYAPDVVALEDIFPTRRGDRAKREIERIAGYAHLREVRRVIVSRHDVRRALGLPDRASKNELADRIASILPDLAPLLPPKRKLWQSERECMNVFDAAGLAIAATTFHRADRRAA